MTDDLRLELICDLRDSLQNSNLGGFWQGAWEVPIPIKFGHLYGDYVFLKRQKHFEDLILPCQ